MSRVVTVMALVAVVAAGVAGCGGSSTPASHVTVTPTRGPHVANGRASWPPRKEARALQSAQDELRASRLAAGSCLLPIASATARAAGPTAIVKANGTLHWP